MLDQALTWLKPGGTLVYCVCSLQPEEGPDQIAALLQRNDQVTVEPVVEGEAGIRAEWISEAGFLRTLPCHAPPTTSTPAWTASSPPA